MIYLKYAAPLIGGLLLLLSGCTAPQTRLLLDQPSVIPRQAEISNVPFYPQEDYYCGPASLAMVLGWAGIPADQHEIARQIYTPGRQGTLPPDVLTGARRNGALAIEVNTLEEILAEIAAGNPVMVFQNLGLNIWPQWHFAVVIGYDLNNESLILHSGLDPRRIHNLNAFEKTWQRGDYWAITVTAPDRLPAQATEITALSAAAGLERAEQYIAAITAYQAISIRWPKSIIARMGHGNTEYKRGNYAEASTAFREAIDINQTYAPAWNNLANTLAAQGLKIEAIAAAHKAVTLDADNAHYQTTLDEISK